MITRTAPQDYYRPRKIIPQRVHICLHCGGVCVDLPRIGVACLDCKRTDFMTVWDHDVEGLRAAIKETNTIIQKIKQLKDLFQVEYPPDLLKARRDSFLKTLPPGETSGRPAQPEGFRSDPKSDVSPKS